MQVLGEAFPRMVLQQNDGVFPNVTNSTGTVSVVSPTGTTVVVIPPGDQVKRYNSAGKPIDNDEILPGYGKEKRQHNVCHLTCTPSYLIDICQSAPTLATCDAGCSLQSTGTAPLDGTNIGHQDAAVPSEDQIACLTHCSCTGSHGLDLVDDSTNGDNPFEGLD